MQVMLSQSSTSIPMSNGSKQPSTGMLFSQLLSTSETPPAESSDGLGGIIMNLLSVGEEIEHLWNLESVNEEEVQSLLDGFPAELREEIERLLQERIDASDVMNGAPEMKLAILLQVMVQDQQQTLTDSQKKELTSLLEKWFPSANLDQKHSLPKQIEQIFNQVKKLMNDQATQDKNTFHKIMEQLSVVKKVQTYAEQAFQRYVPTKTSEQLTPASKEFQTFQSPLSPLEQWTLRVPASSDEGQKQFTREIQQLITRGKLIVNEAGFAKLHIKLTPEHLGTIEIQLVQKQGEITARIIASSQAAKEALDGQLSQLKQSFAGQNIEFEKLEVFFQKDEQSFEFHDQENQNHEDRKRTEDDDSSDELDSNGMSFEEQLSQIVLNEKV
ncbi:flagellar hook-length control protein FliK [Fictibacillus nanhaiensis]|uniref:flagellar hook-length control protein FliK n=1 Tax=Fictibacillus nanhaiensis TaxID=742169 RepID=UPI001C98C3C4|nr:flagellar hook-length control protein FliK [Fictibacillus nanhaiensis]MBY6036090.1 flagellar hook-length control protein FliK [Fictibacillus nanhaiensis]